MTRQWQKFNANPDYLTGDEVNRIRIHYVTQMSRYSNVNKNGGYNQFIDRMIESLDCLIKKKLYDYSESELELDVKIKFLTILHPYQWENYLKIKI